LEILEKRKINVKISAKIKEGTLIKCLFIPRRFNVY
jgi:hypothetical protein